MPTHLIAAWWSAIAERRWSDARALLAENFNADWPQTDEHFATAETFVAVNAEYPGTHQIHVLRIAALASGGDPAHSNNGKAASTPVDILSEVEIESAMPDGQQLRLFAVSFFTVQDGRLTHAREYWADRYAPPPGREHLTMRSSAQTE